MLLGRDERGSASSPRRPGGSVPSARGKVAGCRHPRALHLPHARNGDDPRNWLQFGDSRCADGALHTHGLIDGHTRAALQQSAAFPGYHWSFNGRSVGPQVVVSSAGPEHCGWQAATFLTIAWPPGTYSDSAAHARQFVRDPAGVTHTLLLLAALDLNTRLPSDAHPTGLTYQGLQIYTSSADIERAVYVVGGGITERWPRSDPMTLCV